MIWVLVTALGTLTPSKIGGFDIPAYFVANARPGERSADTHSCSAEQGNTGESPGHGGSCRGAVSMENVSFLRKQVIGES